MFRFLSHSTSPPPAVVNRQQPYPKRRVEALNVWGFRWVPSFACPKYQPVPANTSQFRQIPASSSKYQPVPANTSQFRQIPASSSKYQPVLASTSKYQPVLASTSKYQPALARCALTSRPRTDTNTARCFGESSRENHFDPNILSGVLRVSDNNVGKHRPAIGHDLGLSIWLMIRFQQDICPILYLPEQRWETKLVKYIRHDLRNINALIGVSCGGLWELVGRGCEKRQFNPPLIEAAPETEEEILGNRAHGRIIQLYADHLCPFDVVTRL
ncbi:hypothetical protein Btru_060050 [Bulinus truncatus]|nr:hypothetical protein Btru_060050 [Bulinus truncatus]